MRYVTYEYIFQNKITTELETICVSLYSHYLFEMKIVLNFKRFISVNIINYWFMTGTAFSLMAYGVKLNGYNKCQYSFIIIMNVLFSSRIYKYQDNKTSHEKHTKSIWNFAHNFILLVKFQR